MKPKATHLTKAQQCEIIVESKSATDFRGIEALHKIVLDIDDQFILLRCSNGRNRCMMNYDDRLRGFNKTLTNRHGMSRVKKFMHSWQMTLHDMFKQ